MKKNIFLKGVLFICCMAFVFSCSAALDDDDSTATTPTTPTTKEQTTEAGFQIAALSLFENTQSAGMEMKMPIQQDASGKIQVNSELQPVLTLKGQGVELGAQSSIKLRNSTGTIINFPDNQCGDDKEYDDSFTSYGRKYKCLYKNEPAEWKYNEKSFSVRSFYNNDDRANGNYNVFTHISLDNPGTTFDMPHPSLSGKKISAAIDWIWIEATQNVHIDKTEVGGLITSMKLTTRKNSANKPDAGLYWISDMTITNPSEIGMSYSGGYNENTAWIDFTINNMDMTIDVTPDYTNPTTLGTYSVAVSGNVTFGVPYFSYDQRGAAQQLLQPLVFTGDMNSSVNGNIKDLLDASGNISIPFGCIPLSGTNVSSCKICLVVGKAVDVQCTSDNDFDL